MCGFAALISSDRIVDRTALAAMGDAMVKRGPDAAGQWLSDDQRVGLAHRRLSIIDLSPAGAQPMSYADGELVIAFNGEIYNHRALRTELEAQGYSFRSHSDTEVLLALYARHGIAMLDHLRGMFAFALWDQKRQGMLLARDPFGIKPLYFSDDGRTLQAASQVKALLAGGMVNTSPDPAGQAGFMLWGHVPDPFTLYRDISALPAGGWLWAGLNGERRQGRHFDLTAELAAAEPGHGDIRAALLDSVGAHLEADVPVGVFLSAGRDSTTLCALATESRGRVRTVSLGFNEFIGTERDETPLAEAVARLYQTDHQTLRVTGSDFTQHRDQIIADMDQPSIDGVNTWFVARAARQRGLKVALSGLGGDELFGGYDTFKKVPFWVSVTAPLALAPAVGRFGRRVAAAMLPNCLSPKLAGLLELGSTAGNAYFLSRGLFLPWELPTLLGTERARAGLERLALSGRLSSSIVGLPDWRRRITALETSWYMRNQLLRDSDWAGMAHSLEIRTPLVDISLFRAILPLLASRRPPTKADLAASARPALPLAITQRPKTGFGIPVAQWLGATNLRNWARHLGRSFNLFSE